MSRNAFVPMTWITSDLNGEALRTLILISTFADTKTGECWPNNATLAEALGKTPRAIQLTIQELKSAGLISIVEFNGRKRKIRIESPEWFDRPPRKTTSCHEGNLHSRGEENLHGRHEGNLHTPMKETFTTDMKKTFMADMKEIDTPYIRTHPLNESIERNGSSGGVSEESKPAENATTTSGQNLEPFESGNPALLPNVRNAVEPFRTRLVELKPTQFKPETRDRIMAVLGHDGEQFARKITQEQADAGFPDWILGEAARNKTPGRLAFHLLKTAWRDGWIDPKAEEEAKRAARRARLEALR